MLRLMVIVGVGGVFMMCAAAVNLEAGEVVVIGRQRMADEGWSLPWFCVCVWLVFLPCLRQSGDAWLQASLMVVARITCQIHAKLNLKSLLLS